MGMGRRIDGPLCTSGPLPPIVLYPDHRCRVSGTSLQTSSQRNPIPVALADCPPLGEDLGVM